MQKAPYKINSPEDITPCRIDTDEQEITITLSRGDKKASIYVSDNTWLTKIKRQWANNLEGWECYAIKNKNGEATGYFFEVSKKAITIRNGKGKNVEQSEEAIEKRKAHGRHPQELRKQKQMNKV